MITYFVDMEAHYATGAISIHNRRTKLRYNPTIGDWLKREAEMIMGDLSTSFAEGAAYKKISFIAVKDGIDPLGQEILFRIIRSATHPPIVDINLIEADVRALLNRIATDKEA